MAGFPDAAAAAVPVRAGEGGRDHGEAVGEDGGRAQQGEEEQVKGKMNCVRKRNGLKNARRKEEIIKTVLYVVTF